MSAPVTIRFRGDEVGRLWPRTLAGLVRFQPSEGGYNLVLAPDGVGRAAGRFVTSATRKPLDATFAVYGNHVRVVRSRGGTRLASTKGAAAILAAGLAPGGARAAAVTLTKQQAELTTRDARALGIKRRISTFTTDMGVSSSNRIHNVLLMGQVPRRHHRPSGPDVLVQRDDRAADQSERGFLEGQMILGGLLVPSIGGGVCQVATTIFNAAFEAGLPIRERHNHSFYISHYPMGRDATVSWGGPDLVVPERPRPRDPDQGERELVDPDGDLLRHAPGAKGDRDDEPRRRRTPRRLSSTRSTRPRPPVRCARSQAAARASASTSIARCWRTAR